MKKIRQFSLNTCREKKNHIGNTKISILFERLKHKETIVANEY